MTLANINKVYFRCRKDMDIQGWAEVIPMGFLRFGGPMNLQVRAATEAAQALANKHQASIRWNFEGSLQGHYVDPDPVPELLHDEYSQK